MKTYGYARVSSADQNATRQLDAMEKADIARADIFAVLSDKFQLTRTIEI